VSVRRTALIAAVAFVGVPLTAAGVPLSSTAAGVPLSSTTAGVPLSSTAAGVPLSATAAVAPAPTGAPQAAAAVAPKVRVTAPAPGPRSGLVTVSAAATDPAGIVKVIFLADGLRVGEDTTAPYSVVWDTAKSADRTWNVRAVAISQARTNAYSAPVSVPVGNAKPRVAVTAPKPGPVAGNVVVSSAAVAPTGIFKVIFLADGLRIGEDTTAPYSVVWNTLGAADRSWNVRAVAIGRSGTNAYSAPVAATVANPSSTQPTKPETPAQRQQRLERLFAIPAGGVFGPSSVWKQSVRGAPVAGTSAAQVQDLARQVRDNWGGVAAFNTWNYNTTLATVGPNQPRTRVIFDDCQHKGYTPWGLYGQNGQFEDVPMPDGAAPASGGDSEITVWSPSTDQLWEFWVAHRRPDGWHACWGGRLDNVSTGPGFFGGGFGATATGLPNVGGVVSFADARRGYIDHALSLQVIDAAKWYQISYPAQRGDGQGSGPIREGTRFRLDPSIDVDRLAINPYAKMIARAAQTYGFIVTDKGGAVAVLGEGGDALVANGGVNPWHDLLGNTPNYSALRGFPWDRLQALPNDWGKPTR